MLLDRAVPIRNPFLNARIPRPSPTAIGPKKRASVRWERKHRNTRENCKIFLMVRLWNVTGAGAPTDRFYTENLAPSGQDPPSLPTTTTTILCVYLCFNDFVEYKLQVNVKIKKSIY